MTKCRSCIASASAAAAAAGEDCLSSSFSVQQSYIASYGVPHDFVQLPVRLSQSTSSNPHTSNRPPSLPLSTTHTRFVGLSYPYIWYSAPIQRLEWIDGNLSPSSLSSWAACPLYCHSVTLPGQARLPASSQGTRPRIEVKLWAHRGNLLGAQRANRPGCEVPCRGPWFPPV